MTVYGLLIFLLFQILFAAVAWIWMVKDNHKIEVTASIGTVTYTEVSKTSSFDVNLLVKHNDCTYYTATDVSYRLRFMDADGTTIAERIVSSDPLTQANNECTVSFGTKIEPAIEGKVASVAAELVDVTFINRIVYEGGAVGKEYILQHWWFFIGFIVAAICCVLARYALEMDGCLGYFITMGLFCVSLVVMTWYTNAIVIALFAGKAV